jgi:ABC-type multidrug transport system ATPase subunit
MPTAALSVRDMTHWYVPDHTVLDGADLTVDRGEVVVVRGPNGSGKTTLLRLAAGIQTPRRGAVRRAAVGYQPQTGEEPPPRMTASAWLAAMARMRRRTGGPAPQEILDALGGSYGGQDFGTLSRGTVTKVLLACALSGAPELVLLDEPFAPLDAAARGAVTSLIRAAASGAGVLLSDHHGAGDLVATRRVRISGHRIVADAGPAEEGEWKIILRVPGDAPRELRVPAAQRDRTLLEALLRGEEVCGVMEIR